MSTSSHPILLAALDLDGTLLNSNGEVSPCTQKVLSEASDRGVVVIPATGRPLASLPPVVAKQPWVHYALTSNGAKKKTRSNRFEITALFVIYSNRIHDIISIRPIS